MTRILAHLLLLAGMVALQGCGGGHPPGDATAAEAQPAPAEPVEGLPPEPPVQPPTQVPVKNPSHIGFFVAYQGITEPPFAPNGSELRVGATEFPFIGAKDIAKVEFLLFGHDTQVLTQANLPTRFPPQVDYLFKLPESFSAASYACTGEHLSEVRVTDVEGNTVSATFELCVGKELNLSASNH